MTITPELIVAVGTAVAAIITSIATFLSSMRNGRKVDQIHTLVNSKMTDAKQEIARLSQRVAMLTGDKDDMQRASAATSAVSDISGKT